MGGLLAGHVYSQQTDAFSSNQLPPLQIAIIESAPPFSSALKDGRTTGLYVDFWRLWAKHNNRQVEFVAKQFSENLEDLRNAKVDFHSGLFKNTERIQWADFSIPIHQVNTSLYFYDKHHPIVPLEQMAGKKIGVPIDSYQASYFATMYPDITFIPFLHNIDSVNDLINGELDALIGEDAFIENLLTRKGLNGILTRSSEVLLSNLVYALFPKAKGALVNEINAGIKNIPVDEIVALEKQWLPASTPYFEQYLHQHIASLSISEIDFLRNLPEITIGSAPNRPPIEFEVDGTYQGVAIDYLNIIKDKLNVRTIHTNDNSWNQIVEKAGKGKIHLLTAIMEAKDIGEDLVLTDPYANFQIVAMTRPNSPPLSSIEDMDGMQVGAVLDGELKTILEEYHPDLSIRNVNNSLQGLKDLRDEKIDVYIGNHFMIAHNLEQLRDRGLKVGLFTDHFLSLRMEVHRDYKQLVPIFNKLFASISNRENVAILNRWKGNETIEINDQFEQFLLFSIPTFVAILVLLIYSTYVNRKMSHEISERIKKEGRLQSEKLIADKANRAKDDFLANMSHELRSPMNAIEGTAFLLANDKLTLSQQDLVDVMDTSAKELLRLINNILDLSKLEANKLALEENSTDIYTLCESLFKQAFQSISPKDSIDTHLIIDKDIPRYLLLDSFRLKQMLSNLLLNAKKYTHHGNITLKLTKQNNSTQSLENIHAILFEVEDTGIGLSQQQLSQVFSSYNQIDASITRNNSGAGLGLKLTQSLCQLMGSKLQVESSAKTGSRFYFTLQAEQQQQEKTTLSNLKNLKIMIVDDNQVNLMITKKLLEHMSATVISKNNGHDAIDYLERESVHAILMDMNMPEMDGVETCMEIRNGKSNQNVPIFALSAGTSEAEKLRAKKSGMNGYLDKPIDVEQLSRVLLNELG